MALTESLELSVTATGQQAVTEFGRVGTAARTQLGAAEKAAADFRTSLAAGFGAAVGVGLVQGIQQVAQSLLGASNAAAADRASQTVLAATLRNSAAATQQQINANEEFIASASHMAGVVDDELRPAFAVLVRSTKDIGDAQILLKTALDVSAGTGRDVTSVATALAKAYEGDTIALKRLLPEVGGLIRDGARFDEILDKLRSSFKGLASERGASDPVARLNVTLDDFRENVGTGVLPVVSALNTGLETLGNAFGALPNGAQSAVTTLAGIGGAGAVVVGGLAVAASAASRLKDILSAFSTTTTLTAGLQSTTAAAQASAAATGVAAGAATTASAALAAESATQLALFDTTGQATFALEGETTTQLALFDATTAATGSLTAQAGAQRGVAASATASAGATSTAGASMLRMGQHAAALAVGLKAAGLGFRLISEGLAGTDGSKVLADLARVTNDELIPAFDKAVQKETGLLDLGRTDKIRNSQFKELADQSLSTAQRVRDAFASAGRDVTAFDVILAKVAAGNKQAAADALSNAGATQALGAAYDAASAAAAKLAMQTATLNAARSALSGALSLGDAQVGFNEALTALTEGTKAAGGRATSELDLERASRGVTAAQRALADAETNLARIRAGASDDERKRAELSRKFADLNAEDAQRSQAEAFNNLQRARRRGSVKEIDDAERAYKRSVLDTQAAIFRQADAQKEQNEVNDRGKEGSKELADAVLEVEDAQFRLREAIAATQQQAGGGQVERSAKEQRDLFKAAAGHAADELQALIDSGAPADVIATKARELEAKLKVAAEKAGITREEFEKTRDALSAIVSIGLLIPDIFGPQGPNTDTGPKGPQAAPKSTTPPAAGPPAPTTPSAPIGPPAPGGGLGTPIGPQAPDVGFSLPKTAEPAPPVTTAKLSAPQTEPATTPPAGGVPTEPKLLPQPPLLEPPSLPAPPTTAPTTSTTTVTNNFEIHTLATTEIDLQRAIVAALAAAQRNGLTEGAGNN